MASPIGPSTSMVQAGSFGSAKYLPGRSRLCCDSLARSRWRRFHFYWARSLAASVGLRWEKWARAILELSSPRRSNTDFQSVSPDKHLACRSNRLGSLSHQSGKMPELHDHALDM